MTLLNMLIGVLCEVIGKKAEEEREIMGETELRLCLSDAFGGMDSNDDGRVTQSEWELMKKDPSVRRCLGSNGIDADALDMQLDKMQSAIFLKRAGRQGNVTGLSLEEFVTRLLEIQPSKAASCLELQLLSAKCKMRDTKLVKYLTALETEMGGMLESRGMAMPVEATGKQMQGMSTKTLFEVLKSRTSPDAPRSAASSPMLLQSAFPTPEAEEMNEMNEPDIGIVHEDRVLARQHPLFQLLVGRNPPGGWAAARFVATQLEKQQLTVWELSQQAKRVSVPELLNAVPELFIQEPGKPVATRQTDDHCHGCPRHASSDVAVRDHRCQCARRLCDALHLFTEGTTGRSQAPMTPSQGATTAKVQ